MDDTLVDVFGNICMNLGVLLGAFYGLKYGWDIFRKKKQLNNQEEDSQ